MGYRLTRQDLLRDLYVAFYDARRHKAKMSYVHHFEHGLKDNIDRLCDALLQRNYTPEPSKCFVVDFPKKREIFSAGFADRVVHHLYYNYTHEMFERTFIADTYSCIKGRGTHYGISRMISHIRQESDNWKRPCYILKLDIKGYFMHIDRQRLLDIATASIRSMSTHKVSKGRAETWADVIDIDFVHWLTEIIVMLDPKKDCVITGYRSDWNGLDKNKSLFFSEDGCGLPIGNLTSQLFSNVYLNILDQWMKRELGCRHYGRYVDDFYVVNCDRDWLLSIIPKTDRLLKERLGLDLHHGKLMVCDARRGVEFLGAYIKPFRTYISNSSLQRIRQNVATTDCNNREKAFRTVNSYLGLMSHYSSYNIRRELFCKDRFYDIGYYDRDMTKITVNHLNLNSEDYEQNVWTKKRFYSRQGGYKPYHRQLWHGASAQHRVCHMA